MGANEIIQWREAEALERFKLISPLLSGSMDSAAKAKLRKQIADENDISLRSLFRYEKAFRENRFEGLKPDTHGTGRVRGPFAGFDKVLAEAIQLKREVPSRSVNQIIFILETEGIVPRGKLSRPTLQRYLYAAGFGKKQMKKYAEARNSSARRFCKPHRMMLAQADIKYVMKLPIGKNGAYVQCYIAALIDDHSRLILSSGVYDHQEADIVEDIYRKAILQYGLFSSTYVDNGKQFVSSQLIRALAQLGIRHLRAKPYAAASKGKIEVYNRLINSYIAECKVQKVKTLEEANHFWQLFVEEYYHTKPHEGIAEYYRSQGVEVPAEGITPIQEFNRDSAQLRFPDSTAVANAFLHHEKRNVDKGACISFRGRKYEVSQSLIGATVEIVYDPMVAETLTVHYPGMAPFTAKPLFIGEFCGAKPVLPESLLPINAETSRFFQCLESKHESSRLHQANAISYTAFWKEENGDV